MPHCLLIFLALASSFYVMLVLQRYVAFRIDATLITLTSGVLLAIGFEYLLRNARLKLAGNIGRQRVNKKADALFGLLSTTNYDVLQKQETNGLFKALDQVENAHAPGNIVPLFDALFASIFLVALFLLHPGLAAIAALFILLAGGITLISQGLSRLRSHSYQQLSGQGADQIGRMINGPEPARLFDPNMGMLNQWRALFPQIRKSRAKINLAQGRMQSLTGMLQGLLGASIIAYGATRVVARTAGCGHVDWGEYHGGTGAWSLCAVGTAGTGLC